MIEKNNNNEDNLGDWEDKLLDDKNQPEFYDVLEVLTLNDNINKVAKAIIIVNIVLGLLSFKTVQSIMLGVFPNISNISAIFLNFSVLALGVGIQIAITYFPLKALAYILRILMEMEFNSRKAKS